MLTLARTHEMACAEFEYSPPGGWPPPPWLWQYSSIDSSKPSSAGASRVKW